jgi:N-methylhydantoinase A/oxoprolinase/acetone carboxylase beta subunit
MASPRLEVLETKLQPADSIGADQLGSIRSRVRDRFLEVFGGAPAEVLVLADARYSYQSHELTIPYRPGELGEDFEVEHELRFGFRLDGVAVEMVNLRAVAIGEPDLTWSALQVPTGDASTETRTGVLDRSHIVPGFKVDGPLLVVDSTATILLNQSEHLEVLTDSTLEITW